MTFDEWKDKQPWLNPVPNGLGVSDLECVWKAGAESEKENIRKMLIDEDFEMLAEKV